MVSRRGFLGMLGLGAGALAVRPLMGQETASGEGGAGAASGKKPNIVLFLVDDMGWQDTSVPFYYRNGQAVVTRLNKRYGHGKDETYQNQNERRTPNMERLAKQGMVFSNAYACAVCSPTRCSLMSGMNAARHRVTDWTLAVNDGGRFSSNGEGLYPPRWAANGLQPPKTAATGSCQPPWCQDANGKYYQPEMTDDPAKGAVAYNLTMPFMNALTFPQVLKNAGYHTIHVGKAHWGSGNGPYNSQTKKVTSPGADPRAFGFDVNIAGCEIGGPNNYRGDAGYGNLPGSGGNQFMTPGLDENNYYGNGNNVFLTDALTEEAIKALGQAKTNGKPFYLYMAHYAIHSPLDNARAWDHTRSANQTLASDTLNPNPNDGLGWNATERNYGTLIKGMDDSLGKLLKWLEENDELENTLFIFMADNGGLSVSGRLGNANAPARAGKGSCYEGGTREPLIAVWPGKIKAGSVSHEPVIIEDFYPTILAAAGVAVPAPEALATTDYEGEEVKQVIDGESFLPVLLGQRETVREDGAARPLLWHYPNKWGEGPNGKAYNFYSALRLGRWKLIYQHSDRTFELYDLEEDISESRNLAAHLPAKVEELRKTMGALLRERGAQMPTYDANGTAVPWPDETPLNVAGGGLTLRN